MHTKTEVDDWLKSIGKTRPWLAEQCGVSPGRVYIWFSKNGVIPAKAQIIIDKLMHESDEKQPSGTCNQRLNLSLELDASTYGIFAVRARACGFPPTPEGIAQWIVHYMQEAGPESITDELLSSDLCAAEEDDINSRDD